MSKQILWFVAPYSFTITSWSYEEITFLPVSPILGSSTSPVFYKASYSIQPKTGYGNKGI